MTQKQTDQTLSEDEIRPSRFKFDQRAAYARDIARMLVRRAEFVARPCPACASEDGKPVFDKDGFFYKRCPACATIYMDPRPSEAVMSSYYAQSENYAHWAKHIFPASEATRRAKIHEPWFQRVLGFCRANGVGTGSLLEVGPGFGTFCAVVRDSGIFGRVQAIEPSPDLAAACRARGLDVIESRVEDAAAHVQPADVVCAFEVIEHLFDPDRFLGDCARLVRDGGLIVLSCPNGQGFDIATLGPLSSAVDAEHVNLFNPDALSGLLRKHGFEVLDVSTPGRLDAELVRQSVLEGGLKLDGQAFLQRVLVDEWERLGWPFQQFLAANGLSSHLWICARRVGGAA